MCVKTKGNVSVIGLVGKFLANSFFPYFPDTNIVRV